PVQHGLPLPPPGKSDLELLAASPLLGRLTALDVNLRGLLVGDAGDFRPGIAALGRSPHALNLASLNLDGHWQQGRGLLRALTRARHLRRLRDLSLAGTGMDDEAILPLATSSLGSGLTRLDVTHNAQVTPEGIRYLLDGALPRLTSLDVDVEGLRRRGVEPLLEFGGLPRLTRLRLQYEQDISGENPSERHESLGLASLPELLGGFRMANLTELLLQGIDVGPEALRFLAVGPLARRLLTLALVRCQVRDSFVPSLKKLLAAGRLRRLLLG